MADLKISQLTGATTPLAGTEVLPIVQSNSTKKVATDDLTVKNVRSNATTGILQIAGPAASATRTMTVPDANFTAARTDAAQSLTGDQTLSTGNLIQGTAAKGVNFTANTPASGMSSQLLNWYEQGTWTPTLAGDTTSATLSVAVGRYTRIGNVVTVWARLNVSSAPTGGNVNVGNLPFTPNGTSNYYTIGQVFLENVTYTGSPAGFMNPGTAKIYLAIQNTGTGYVDVNGSAMSSSTAITLTTTFHV